MSFGLFINFTYKLFTNKSCIYIYIYIYTHKHTQNLALNNPQGLICHKTLPNQWFWKMNLRTFEVLLPIPIWLNCEQIGYLTNFALQIEILTFVNWLQIKDFKIGCLLPNLLPKNAVLFILQISLELNLWEIPDFPFYERLALKTNFFQNNPKVKLFLIYIQRHFPLFFKNPML